jgi:hypothetical protein
MYLDKESPQDNGGQHNGKSDTFYFHAGPGRVRHDLYFE